MTTAVRECRAYVLDALTKQMVYRSRHPDDWEQGERLAVAVAANEWAVAHGFERRITVADIEHVEGNAVGHSDYASKLALYVAETLIDPWPWQVREAPEKREKG